MIWPKNQQPEIEWTNLMGGAGIRNCRFGARPVVHLTASAQEVVKIRGLGTHAMAVLVILGDVDGVAMCVGDVSCPDWVCHNCALVRLDSSLASAASD